MIRVHMELFGKTANSEIRPPFYYRKTVRIGYRFGDKNTRAPLRFTEGFL